MIYLSGPIYGCSDDEANGWRNALMAKYPEQIFLNPMVRDYRGTEDVHVEAIVRGDIADIRRCVSVVANCLRPSVGTSMELVYAYQLGKPVTAIAVDPVSPWLRFHASAIVGSLDEVTLR